MVVFIAVAKEDGGLQMSEYQRQSFRQFLKDNAGRKVRLELEKEYVESRKQRKMYHGAYLPLWAYLDGKDYKDAHVLADMHEAAKMEFNPQVVVIHGKAVTIGGSTRGELNKGFMDRFLNNLIDNYGIDPAKVLNPDHYKHFRDAIWPFTEKYDTYIDYLRDLKLLE